MPPNCCCGKPPRPRPPCGAKPRFAFCCMLGWLMSPCWDCDDCRRSCIGAIPGPSGIWVWRICVTRSAKHVAAGKSFVCFELTESCSPPMLPNVMLLLWLCRPDGGRPPLACGCGIGDGECAGDVTRGSARGVGSEDVCDWCGALGCGEPDAPIEPKLIGGLVPFCPTGPPFGIWPLAPDAFITTDCFLLWSVCADAPFG